MKNKVKPKYLIFKIYLQFLMKNMMPLASLVHPAPSSRAERDGAKCAH
jgi:hypothetical protein